MKIRALVPLALLSASMIAPASANWFSNPRLGINRNIGSAPSPTPQQVRQAQQPPFVMLDERTQPPSVAAAGAQAAQRLAQQETRIPGSSYTPRTPTRR